MTEESAPSIMVVDDTPANLKLLTGMLQKHGFKVRPLLSGKVALASMAEAPPDMILLDITMPEMNGYEVCEQIKADPLLRAIPVIFISALSEVEDKVNAFRRGGLDYITKPFQVEEVLARVQTHLELRQLRVQLERHNEALQERVEAQVREISDSQVATIIALAKMAEARDVDTGQHIERTQLFCRLLAQRMQAMPRFERQIDAQFISLLFQSAPLHDIGKVAIPDAVLLKPGKLTPEECAIMQTHALQGARTLQAVHDRYPANAFIAMGIQIALCHHERWDGSGYPNHISEEKIPLAARIMAVADVYDALTSVRCYKVAFSHEDSCEIIRSGAGRHFDPGIVQAFMTLEHDFRTIRETHSDNFLTDSSLLTMDALGSTLVT